MGNNLTFDEYSLISNDSIVSFSTQGGYVSSWKIKNSQTGELEDVLYQGSTIKRSGIPLLFPQFWEAKGMRKHGFGRDSLWKVAKQYSSSFTMKLTNADLASDAQKEYPHQFEAMIVVQQGKKSIEYSLHVKNTGTEDLPISPGLHPYWAVPHKDKKGISIEGLPKFHANLVDWDSNPPDIGYPYQGKIVVHLPNRQITIEDITPQQPVITHIVVWSQTPKQDDYHYVCIEPVCGYNHAFDMHPILIKPGKDWQMKLRFSVP